MNPDIVAGYHLGCCSSKILEGETSILPNAQALLIKAGLLELFRYGLSADAYIVEGEILSDSPVPPASRQFDYRFRHDENPFQLQITLMWQ